MDFLKKKSKSSWLLLLILAFGLILRALNPTFGSPSLYISNDEAVAHLSALNMLAEKTPVSIANYTPLGAYIQIPFLIASFAAMKLLGLIKNVSDFELFLLTHEGYFLFIPRLISGLFGTLTILVIYKMTFLLFHFRGEKSLHLGGISDGKNVALVAAFLGAVSFNLVHISHFGRPWSAALFFFVLAVYLILKRKPTFSYLSVGLAYGFHQVGIFIIPLVLLIFKRFLAIKNLLGVMIMAILIVIFSSLTLKVGIINSIEKGQSFLKSSTLITDLLSGNYKFPESISRTLIGNLSIYFIINFLITDGVILIFGIWGIFKVLGQDRSKKILIAYLLFYFLFASFFFHPLLRYLLPIILLLIPFAAYVIYNALFKNGSKYIKSIKWVLIAVVLTLATINSLWWNYLYLKTPTFIQTRNWINNNISSETPIAYTGGRFQTFTPNLKAIKQIQTVSPNSYDRLESLLTRNNAENVRNIIYLGKFPGRSKIEQLENAAVNYPVKYVVDYYLDEKERLLNLKPQDFEILIQFKPTRSDKLVGVPEPLFDPSWNFPTNDPRPKVSMYSLARIGPYFDILRVKNY